MNAFVTLMLFVWIGSRSGHIEAAPLPSGDEVPKDRPVKEASPLVDTLQLDEILLEDSIAESGDGDDEILLADILENMDAQSLILLLGRLREEYTAKAGPKDAEKVRSSFDKLTTTLLDLSSAQRRVVADHIEVKDMLSEEEDEMYTDYYEYSYDDELEEEEEGETYNNPSLLDFPGWDKTVREGGWIK